VTMVLKWEEMYDLDHTSESAAEWKKSSCRRFELEVLLLTRKEEDENSEVKCTYYSYKRATVALAGPAALTLFLPTRTNLSSNYKNN